MLFLLQFFMFLISLQAFCKHRLDISVPFAQILSV